MDDVDLAIIFAAPSADHSHMMQSVPHKLSHRLYPNMMAMAD